MTGIRITGWGIALPDKVVTNDDLAVSLDTSDAWITERKEQGIAPPEILIAPVGQPEPTRADYPEPHECSTESLCRRGSGRS